MIELTGVVDAIDIIVHQLNCVCAECAPAVCSIRHTTGSLIDAHWYQLSKLW
jgi:hypothetical protein